MTSATEVLRRLLDERGVEWGASDTYRLLVTSWSDASGHSWSFMEHRDGSFSKLTAYHLTPEQAIAATLGSCNCSNNCTNSERTGTCYDTGESRIFHCSECDLGLDDVFIDDEERYTFADFPRFCPFCGAEVVSE